MPEPRTDYEYKKGDYDSLKNAIIAFLQDNKAAVVPHHLPEIQKLIFATYFCKKNPDEGDVGFVSVTQIMEAVLLWLQSDGGIHAVFSASSEDAYDRTLAMVTSGGI